MPRAAKVKPFLWVQYSHSRLSLTVIFWESACHPRVNGRRHDANDGNPIEHPYRIHCLTSMTLTTGNMSVGALPDAAGAR